MGSSRQQRKMVGAAIQQAAMQLNVRCQWPFDLHGSTLEPNDMVFLPDFGGANGAVAFICDLSAEQTTASRQLADRFRQAAKVNERWASVINAHTIYDEQALKDMLDDWGYYGPPDQRPSWYTGTPWTQQPPRR